MVLRDALMPGLVVGIVDVLVRHGTGLRVDRWPEIKRRILIALRAEVVFLSDQEDLHAEAWKVVEGRSLRHNPLPDDLHVIVARKRHRVLFDDHRAFLSTRLDILHGPLEIINEKTLAATIGATTDAEGGRRAAELPAAGPLRLSKQCQPTCSDSSKLTIRSFRRGN